MKITHNTQGFGHEGFPAYAQQNAQGQQPKAPHSQTQQVKKPQVNQAQLEEEFKSNLKSLYQEYIRRVEVARQDKNDYEKRVQNESATAIGNAGFTPAEASDFIEKAEARFKGQVKLYRDEYKSDLADELDNYNTQGGDGDRAATILKDHAYVPRLD